MISHKHKCIFIHIPKCAGSSVEEAFGLYNLTNKADYNSVTGWCNKNEFLMQHATPQQLLDYGLISLDQWNSYYKFIIYRNSWDKSLSDYMYLYNTSNLLGDFRNYLNGLDEYFEKLNILNCTNPIYEGSHLTKQIDYYYLNNEIINYDLSFNFKNIKVGLQNIIYDLKLDYDFFDLHLNKSQRIIKHYSLFYNDFRKKMISDRYKEDIEFFEFKFDDKKKFREKLISNLNSQFIIKNINTLKLTKE